MPDTTRAESVNAPPQTPESDAPLVAHIDAAVAGGMSAEAATAAALLLGLALPDSGCARCGHAVSHTPGCIVLGIGVDVVRPKDIS